MSHLAFFNNIGTPELLMIFVAVLLLFGPKAIPKLARSLGQGMREFKDATNKVTESITNLDEDDPKPVARVPRGTIDRIKSERAADNEETNNPHIAVVEPVQKVTPAADRSAEDDNPATNPT